jgi:hypothetical protein
MIDHNLCILGPIAEAARAYNKGLAWDVIPFQLIALDSYVFFADFTQILWLEDVLEQEILLAGKLVALSGGAWIRAGLGSGH